MAVPWGRKKKNLIIGQHGKSLVTSALSTYAHFNTHNRSSITFLWLPHRKHHHISAPSRLRMFILHFTEEHWTLGIVMPLSILSGIIAWTITTDTCCEVALLMFKGLVLGQPNKKDLGTWQQELALYGHIWFDLYYSRWHTIRFFFVMESL